MGKPTIVEPLAVDPDGTIHVPSGDAWWNNTDRVRCPRCGGLIRWHEAGYVPGWRQCDGCGREYLADRGVLKPQNQDKEE